MNKVMKMLACAALLIPGASSAQSGFKFGVKGGLNLTTMPTSDRTWLEYDQGFVRQSKFKAGGHVGPTISIGFGRHGNASVVADLLFSMKGSSYVYDQYYFENPDDTVTTKLDVKESVTRLCVDLPILFRYRTNFGLYGEAGIFLSVAASTIFTSDDPRYESNEFDYYAIEEGLYRPLDVGFTGGIGWISKGGFGLGLRGFMGMLDQYETYSVYFTNGLFTPTGRTVNVGMMFSGMYYFGWDARRRR